jgi:membrane-associated phospholipid phosphatase
MQPPPLLLALAVQALALVGPANRLTAQARPFPYALGAADAVVLPLGVGLTLLGNQVGSSRAALTPDEVSSLDPADVNRFDRFATRSWSPAWADLSGWALGVEAGAAIALTFALPVAEGRWAHSVVLGTLFTESFLLVHGATFTAKGWAGRKRPYLYNTGLGLAERVALADSLPDDSRQSFFSGHAAASFTAAVLLSTVFQDLHGRSTASDVVWATSLSVAGLTALARVKAGVHYPSDVLVGAAVGAAIGTLVPCLHRGRTSKPVTVSATGSGLRVDVRF